RFDMTARAAAPSESPIADGPPFAAPLRSGLRLGGAARRPSSGAAPKARSPAAHLLDWPCRKASTCIYIMQVSISAPISVAPGAKLTQGRPLNDPVLPENLIRETRGRA